VLFKTLTVCADVMPGIATRSGYDHLKGMVRE
jgi:hypothetical protein